MIKCYDFYNELIDYKDFERSLNEGTKLIIETEEDYQKLKEEVCDNKAFCKVDGKGEYKYFYISDKFIKACSFEEACNALKLSKEDFNCEIENDKYYVGIYED